MGTRRASPSAPPRDAPPADPDSSLYCPPVSLGRSRPPCLRPSARCPSSSLPRCPVLHAPVPALRTSPKDIFNNQRFKEETKTKKIIKAFVCFHAGGLGATFTSLGPLGHQAACPGFCRHCLLQDLATRPAPSRPPAAPRSPLPGWPPQNASLTRPPHVRRAPPELGPPASGFAALGSFPLEVTTGEGRAGGRPPRGLPCSRRRLRLPEAQSLGTRHHVGSDVQDLLQSQV